MNDDDNLALPPQDATAVAGSGRSAGSTEGWIPPPPRGRPHIPWDLYQTLMKACHRQPLPPRKDSLLPYLVIRAVPGDRGGRPLSSGTIWWESPDIFVLPNQAAATAPDLPPNPNGQLTYDGSPNTIYAHIWNLGRGPVVNARVEFYWRSSFDLSPPTFIGLTHVTLGARSSPSCHAVVHCPVDFVIGPNGVALIVRVFCPFLDPLSTSELDASTNRHVAQRGITVMSGPEASAESGLSTTLHVVASQGTRRTELATVQTPPDQVPWLQLLTGQRDHGRRPPVVTPTVGITPPTAAPGQREIGLKLRGILDDALRRGLAEKRDFRPTDAPVQVTLVAKAPAMAADEALVVRIQQKDDGKLVAGYTAILLPLQAPLQQVHNNMLPWLGLPVLGYLSISHIDLVSVGWPGSAIARATRQ